MSNQPIPNAWDTAWNPPAPSFENYGQITVNPWHCALVKGQGKVAWDPQSVDPNTGQPARRYTAITMKLLPLSNKPDAYEIERTLIAELPGEWQEIVLPSMKAIGLGSLQDLNNRWVKCEMVETGRSYTNGQGETKQATTFKFLQVFASEQECHDAWAKAFGGNGNSAPAPAAQQVPVAPNGGNGSKEKETAQKFLKPYVQNAWRQASGDLDKARAILAPMLAQQPLIAKYFTVDSQEVLDLLVSESTSIPF